MQTYAVNIAGEPVALPIVPINQKLAISLLMVIDMGVKFGERVGKAMADHLRPLKPDIIVGAATIWLSLTLTFVLTLALPPVLSAPGDVHRLAAGMFTISYSIAVVVPMLSGFLWDMTGISETAFAPLAVCAIMIAALAPGLPILSRRKG